MSDGWCAAWLAACLGVAGSLIETMKPAAIGSIDWQAGLLVIRIVCMV